MNTHWAKMAVGVGIWISVALAGFGAAVWQLWNLLMPDLFALPSIGYWQACGLMGLCWLLFGGWRWSGRTATTSRRPLTDDELARLRSGVLDRIANGPAAS